MNSTIKKLSEVTALYSDLDWQYNNAMSGPYEDLRNKSDDGETVAGLRDGRITGAWRPMVCVGSDKWQKSEIHRLWYISNDIYFMDFLVKGEVSEVSKFLLKKGYRARPVYTQIIDLTKSKEGLHADLRKSYKSIVNKTENIFLTYTVAPICIIEAVRKIYQGKRDDNTWDIQNMMLIKNQAYCVIAPDTYAFIYCNENVAYYASGRGKGDAHAVLWIAILEAKRKGCKIFELGEQVYHVGQIMMDGRLATEKHVNISHFKAGFGGKTVTRLILEK